MSSLNILIIEQSSGDDELKKTLLTQGHITTSIALESLDIIQLTESIKPNVILFNANQPTESILQSISDDFFESNIRAHLNEHDYQTYLLRSELQYGGHS